MRLNCKKTRGNCRSIQMCERELMATFPELMIGRERVFRRVRSLLVLFKHTQCQIRNRQARHFVRSLGKRMQGKRGESLTVSFLDSSARRCLEKVDCHLCQEALFGKPLSFFDNTKRIHIRVAGAASESCSGWIIFLCTLKNSSGSSVNQWNRTVA